jgi:hypothetical protein
MANRLGTLTGAFTYNNPVISAATMKKAKDETGPALIELVGTNFGSTDHSMTAAVGIISCATSKWVSDSAITCTVPSFAEEGPLYASFGDGKGKICRRCESGFTVACSSTDPGFCIDCVTCSAGEYTINCNAITERR